MMRRTPLRRHRALRPHRAPRLPAKKTARKDSPYRRFVRNLPCIATDLSGMSRCSGSVEAAHMVVLAGDRGVGLKAHDRQCVPLCRKHHREFDTHAGYFAGWARERRREQGRAWVEAVQLLSTPEDHETALSFEDLGLGHIETTETGWRWVEGPEAAA